MASRRLRLIKLGLAATVGAFLVVFLVLKLMPDAESKPVQATVTAIRPADDAYHMMVWVTAQAPTGEVSSTIVPLQNLRCRVGDTVDGVLRGTTMSLRERTCRRRS
jgi:hypothetical protein